MWGGYDTYWQVLNSKDFGIPQNRERVFAISIREDLEQDYIYPKGKMLDKTMFDLLEKDVDAKYFITPKMKATLLGNSGNWKMGEIKYEINRNISRTINTREGCYRSDASEYICDELPRNYNILQIENLDKYKIRRLTPKECWRLMGFSDEEFEKARKVNSDTQLYRQAGNSIVVDVLEAILMELIVRKKYLKFIQMKLWR